MFDRVIPVSSPSRGWRTFLIVGTVAGHAAVLVALVLVAFWKIEKLPLSDDREVLLSIAPEAPPPGGPPPGQRLTPIERAVIPPKIKPDVPVQPTKVVTPAVAVKTGGPAGTGPTGPGVGTNRDGPPDSTEIGDGACGTPPCGETKPVVVEKKIVETKAVILAPDVAAGLRIAGNEKIYPPDSVKVAMVHADQGMVQATIKLCVDASGGIESVKLMKSTGYRDYDALLTSTMQSWRYRPYKVNGVATPMCTVQIVIYRMRK